MSAYQVKDPAQLYKELNDASPFFVFAGPCVVESEEHAMMMAQRLKEISQHVGVPIVCVFVGCVSDACGDFCCWRVRYGCCVSVRARACD